MFKISAKKQSVRFSLRTNGQVVLVDSASADLKPMTFSTKSYAQAIAAMFSAAFPVATWAVTKA